MKHSLLFTLSLCCALTVSSAAAQPDPIPERALVNAVEKGDRATVLALLNRGVDINKKWINDTPLEAAIFHQDIETVTLLLYKGAKIDPGDLADAAHGAQGNKEKALAIVNLLIAKGADVRAESAKALREAVNADNLEVFRLLLSKGADPNGKDESGESVLMAVIRYDSMESIQALLQAGADVKAVDKDQQTILMRAARTDYRSATTNRITLLKLLINRGADVRARDSSGRTALHWSVEQIMTEGGGFTARPEVVRFLLDNGAEVNAQDYLGQTALIKIVAAWKNPIAIPQLLIEKGANVNLGDKDGVTALMLSAEKGRSDLVQLLLEKGATLDAKDKLGRTAIVHATEAGQTEVVSQLANKGADLSLTSYKNEAGLRAALHKFMLIRAVTYHQEQEVRNLLDRGVDPNSRDGHHVPALVIAARDWEGVETMKLLLARGANVNAAGDEGTTALMTAAGANSREGIALLLRHKASVNLKNKEEKSALMIAADGGHTQIAEELLAAGADFKARDAEGRTALLLASMSTLAQDELVKLLLAKGADVNAVDDQGNTALMLAANAGEFQIVASLIDAGANVNAKNKAGLTALGLARESKSAGEPSRAEILKSLTKAGAKE